MICDDIVCVWSCSSEKMKSDAESPCTCDDCQRDLGRQDPIESKRANGKPARGDNAATQRQNNNLTPPTPIDNGHERTVDVLVHDAPPDTPQFFESVTSTPYYHAPPPPPGFIVAPYQTPKFHTGGNVDDLLVDIQATPATLQTTFIQQNSVFMCNTKRITHKQCCCQKRQPDTETQNDNQETPPPKSYVTEKNIELTYDYPRSPPIPSPSPKSGDDLTTTTEVASTVVFVERRIPVKPKKFDFFFRSRSAPVGETEEPIYATVNKLPKRLRRIELANLEKEVAYKSGEPDSSTRTEITLKTDSESQIPPPEDDTSRSEKEKITVNQRNESPKTKKRKRFSLTFKKRERKKKEKKKETRNGTPKNVLGTHVGSDNERLIEVEVQDRPKHCARHKPRHTLSTASSGPRYKRDSYQEMTTSHSEHERTNSVCSSVNSLGSGYTHKSRKLSAEGDVNIPWCGCWGAGCV